MSKATVDEVSVDGFEGTGDDARKLVVCFDDGFLFSRTLFDDVAADDVAADDWRFLEDFGASLRSLNPGGNDIKNFVTQG
jgi:hypothetical protein